MRAAAPLAHPHPPLLIEMILIKHYLSQPGGEMKFAIFSDVHGNLVALQTLLDHLASEPFDAIYCLGDLFTPYPGSRAIWDRIKAARVECVLGNNEVALCKIRSMPHRDSAPCRTVIPEHAAQ